MGLANTATPATATSSGTAVFPIAHDNPVFKYALTCAAATVAETVTFPLDLTKTRLQIQGESHPHLHEVGTTSVHKGMVGTAVGIVEEGGILMLWQGLSAAILRHLIYSGVRVCVYEELRDEIFSKNTDGSFPVWKSCLSGAIGGVLAQLLASPADLVKVRMQMEGKRRLQGLPPRIHGVNDAFRKIVGKSGVLGLWKGWVPNCQRAALVNMADLAAYDFTKHQLLRHTNMKDNSLTHALSSIIAGFCACCASTPADVIKTRVMNQPTDALGKGRLYRSSVDCLAQTVKKEGAFALYKGFFPIWMRMGPWSLTFWVSYEQIRKLFGFPSF